MLLVDSKLKVVFAILVAFILVHGLSFLGFEVFSLASEILLGLLKFVGSCLIFVLRLMTVFLVIVGCLALLTFFPPGIDRFGF